MRVLFCYVVLLVGGWLAVAWYVYGCLVVGVGVLDVFGLLVRDVACGVVVSAFCCVLLLCGVNTCAFDVSVDIWWVFGGYVVYGCLVVCALCVMLLVGGFAILWSDF